MHDNEKRLEIGLVGFCLLFYLIFPFLDGPVWCVDSNSYAAMDITREPLYPTFLWVFRRMFGEGNYLMPVVAVQSVLGAYAAWKLAVTVKEYKEGSRILAVLAVCFQIGVVLLNRFVAKRGSSYTVSIMTEGMGFPLYVLFIVQLYNGKKGKESGRNCSSGGSVGQPEKADAADALPDGSGFHFVFSDKETGRKETAGAASADGIASADRERGGPAL